MKKNVLADYGIVPGNDVQLTGRLADFLDGLDKTEAVSLSFAKGEYHFYPQDCHEKFLSVSNHDEDTVKKIAFDLSGFASIEICGNGAEFIFHTRIIPFYVHKCQSACLADFSIDYYRPAYSEGRIVAVSDKVMDMYIDAKKYPYHIKDSRVFFTGENFASEVNWFIEMDQTSMAPAYGTGDLMLTPEQNASEMPRNHLVEQLDADHVRFTFVGEQTFFKTSKVGNYIILRHNTRSHPAVYLTDSSNISLKNITVHHAAGMACIAERCENISLDAFNVCRNNFKRRCFTAVADATHFVYCRGKLTIQNCLFENQLDDAINVHGIYVRIVEVLSSTELIAELVHRQHKGTVVAFEGDHIAFVDSNTMRELASNKVRSVSFVEHDRMRFAFETEIDPAVKPGDVLENLSWAPEVFVSHCVIRNNRARGILLTSKKRVEVSHCFFSVPGAGVLIEGDASNWFESGGTTDIHIHDNHFENCSYITKWGKAPIQVSPSVKSGAGSPWFHQKLVVENNCFVCIDKRLVRAAHLETLVFKNNRVLSSAAYPAQPGEDFALENIGSFVQ